VTIFYDPMIAKLIVWDQSRSAALLRMREALAACEVVGPKSNIDFLERLVRHPAVVDGSIDTGYLDRHLEQFLPAAAAPDAPTLFAAASAALLDEEAQVRARAGAGNDRDSPWNSADAWRLAHHGKRIVCFAHGGARIEVDAHGAHGDYALAHGDVRCTVTGAQHASGTLSLALDGEVRRYRADVDATRVILHDGQQRVRFERIGAFDYASTAHKADDRILAPMPGRIVVVKARAGEAVEHGQELVVIEAMKMELSLKAPHAATIASVHAVAGEFVEADVVLVRFEET